VTRRELIALLGSTAATWPVGARAQQPAMPVIAFISGRSADASARYVTAFRKGLSEAGYVEGKSVSVEYNWLEGHYDRLPDSLGLVHDIPTRGWALIPFSAGCRIFSAPSGRPAAPGPSS
jgi:hypothetical protein